MTFINYLMPLTILFTSCAGEPSGQEQYQLSENEEGTSLIVKEIETNKIDSLKAENDTELIEHNPGSSMEYEDVDWDAYELSMTKDYSFVIVLSTKNYQSALERAKDAADKLGYSLDLRELHPHAETGLALPKEVCEGICGGGVVDYPCYLPRNDWSVSKYVSIEYSDGYEGFTPGYYIVIVASGEKGDPEVKEAVEEARKYYKDAYAKTCGVYMGCGC